MLNINQIWYCKFVSPEETLSTMMDIYDKPIGDLKQITAENLDDFMDNQGNQKESAREKIRKKIESGDKYFYWFSVHN